MPGLTLAARKLRCRLPVVLWSRGLGAQTCLIVSSAANSSNNHTALLDLALSRGGSSPAAVQWTFQYAPSGIRSLSVDDGPGLNAVEKTTTCAGDAATHNCLVAGRNTKTFRNGVIAKVTAWLSFDIRTAAIQITNPYAASADGLRIPIVAGILSTAGRNLAAECKVPTQPKGATEGK